MILEEGANPPFFYLVKKGLVNVEKLVEFTKQNVWPSEHHQWQLQSRTKKTPKLITVIREREYFGEVELLSDSPISCKLIAASEL